MKANVATLGVDEDLAWLRSTSLGYTLWRRFWASSDTEQGTWTLDLGAMPESIWANTPIISVKGNRATITSGAGSWHLPLTAKAPEVLQPSVNPSEGWHEGEYLRVGWKPLLPAMGRDYSRPRLCALEVTVSDGHMSATATDGARLAHWESQGIPHAISKAFPDGTHAWPADAVRWLDKQREWEWQVKDDGIWCMGGSRAWVLQATPILGYPDYRSILENLAETAICELDAKQTKQLAAAVKRCTVGKAPKRLTLAWTDGSHRVQLTSHSGDRTAAATTTPADETHGDASFLLDPTLLQPMLAALGAQPVTLYSQGPDRPIHVHSGGQWMFLQMHCIK